MLARREQAEQGFIRQHRRDGIKASSQSLADDRHIRADILMLRGEQFPGPAQTRLNFIRHQQNIVLLADFRNLLQISSGRDDDPAFALDRLEQDRGGIGCDRFFDGIRIAVWDSHKAGRERTEVIAIRAARWRM